MGMISRLKKIKSDRARSVIQYCIYFPVRFFFILFRIFSIKKNRVVISNFNGKGYGCNPKYIAEELMNRGGFEIIWLLKKSNSSALPDKIRKVNILSPAAWYYMATAKVWISNNRQPYYVLKRKKQYYVQTYHACLPMKKIESDINMPSFYVSQSKHDSKMADLVIVNGKKSHDIYSTCFWYSGSYYFGGAPRNDILYHTSDSDRMRIRNRLGIKEGCRVVLYAPTFRNSEDLSPYSINFNALLEALHNRLGGRWLVIVRLHPVLINRKIAITWNSNIIDGTTYPDIQELLAISDICITDYSSCILDYMVTHRPGFIFATDYDEYIKERGFYFDPKSLPFPFSQNNQELIKIITEFDYNAYEQDLQRFMESLCITEKGNATAEIVDLIQKNL